MEEKIRTRDHRHGQARPTAISKPSAPIEDRPQRLAKLLRQEFAGTLRVLRTMGRYASKFNGKTKTPDLNAGRPLQNFKIEKQSEVAMQC